MKSAAGLKDWQKYYSGRTEALSSSFLDLSTFLNLPKRLIVREIGECITAVRQEKPELKLIEIGAGDSDILIDIARRYRIDEACGLDCLPQAVSKLEEKAVRAGIRLRAICADLFFPPEDLLGQFDVVYSLGVVEHFEDLTAAIRAISKFVRSGGLIMTLIPNLKDSLVYAPLMKVFNEKVYRAHFLYGKQDLYGAHEEAGLRVRKCEYLVSSNFGMLSWCFADRHRGLSFRIYKQLTRISKAVWYFEDRYGCLRPTKYFSPYIICIAEKPK